MMFIKKIKLPLLIGKLFTVESLGFYSIIVFAILVTKYYQTYNLTALIESLLIILFLGLFILNPKVSKYLFDKRAVFLITYGVVLFFFFKRYGWFLNSYIFYDDYPLFYATTKKGVDMLWQGGRFGWDSSMLGGFHNISDGNCNLSFFALPLILIFGFKVGLNVFYLCSFLAFPMIVYFCLRSWFQENNRMALIGMLMSVVFLFSLFKQFLGWGMIDNLIGLDCYILNLALFKRFLDRKKLSSFFLVVSVIWTLYAHISYFFCSLVTFVILLVIGREKANAFKRAGFIFVSVAICTLPAWYYLRYKEYFVDDVWNFIPQGFNFSFSLLLESFKKGLAGFDKYISYWQYNEFIKVWLLPFFLWVFFSIKDKKPKIILGVLVLLTFLLDASGVYKGELFARMYFVSTIFYIIILAWIIEKALSIGRFTRIITVYTVLFLFACLWLCSFPEDMFTTTTKYRLVKDLNEYNGELVKKIGSLDGNLILLESQGSWNYGIGSKRQKCSEVLPNHVHLESVMALETGKNFFSSNQEGFHRSSYRANTFICGTYKGDFISEYPVAEINELMTKWGIKYLVLWSTEAKNYFTYYQDFYNPIWNDKEWTIFEYLESDPRSVAVANGAGGVEYADYFSKVIRLTGVRKGDRAVLRTNYFPAWQAYYKGEKLDLYNYQGQIALVVPADGELVVQLKFPRLVLLNILAGLVILTCFWLSIKNII
jgi:hypothetical protein